MGIGLSGFKCLTGAGGFTGFGRIGGLTGAGNVTLCQVGRLGFRGF